ncbi:MAG: putative enoyl-CoA hydratase echA8 [Acidimicrobiales bacterium]|nr:MAG: enoyl-CoA hydratase/isomerase family protein [Actinomycetota bacterium]MBV6508013.1 putative enoyl-CoA hydratase echA8 [Acidimicrobiales bacterium]RIK02418.1 MAG: enoyl-CoA hydratase/isomerase family protein [Acidobacteriota bacterium]
MADDILLSERLEAEAARLTLNRPAKRNALSIELRDAVSDELDRLATDEAVKVVIITGAGDVFSAGFDLREFETAGQDPAFERDLWASSDRFHHCCLRFPLPLIAAVNGPALAGGFDLATMCDMRVAAETAVFARPEAAWADVLYRPLHDLVGGALARDLSLTGREVGAEEALALRLVDRVVPADELAAESLGLAATIARRDRATLVRTKQKFIDTASIAARQTLDL